MPAHAFDVVLAAGLVATGALLLGSRDFVRGTVLFIAFGLLMALTWVRLLAPDIALAEAAIGAGVTGVLLIDALRQLEWGRQQPARPLAHEPARPLVARAVPVAAAVVMLSVLLTAVAHLPGAEPGLARQVQAEMTTIEHPVTAVLLVFRGFDTMLELGILVLAVLGMLTVRSRHGLAARVAAPPHDPMLHAVVRLLVPLAITVAGYTLWLGTVAAGGAFQAGVILGAAGILLWISRHRSVEAAPAWAWHGLVALGFAAFTVFAGVTAVRSVPALAYPSGSGYSLVLALEFAAAVSIGAAFTALFVGMHPARDAGRAPRGAPHG